MAYIRVRKPYILYVLNRDQGNGLRLAWNKSDYPPFPQQCTESGSQSALQLKKK